MASICTQLCATAMTEHTQNECNSFVLGDAPRIALIFCDDVYDDLKVDFEDNALWTTALADPNDAILIQNISVAMTSEINEIENPIANGTENVSDGINYTLSFTDPNVNCENNTMYGALNGRQAYIAVIYNDERLWVSEAMFTVYATLPNIEKGALQVYQIKAQKKFTRGKSWLCFETAPNVLLGK